MNRGEGISYEGAPTTTPVMVYANISAGESISEGYALCFDSDNATAANRTKYVEKPTLANLKDFAGVVAPGHARTGPGYIAIIPWDGQVQRGATVYTDESVAAGDLLEPVPGTYAFGKCVIGTPVFRTTEAVDRSVTAGTVTGDFGSRFAEESSRILRFVDDFLKVGASATGDAAQYVLTGTGATFTGADALGPEAAAAAQGAGVGVLSALTTGFEANLQLNGEPFRLDRSLFFRARVAPGTVNSESRQFVGLNLAGSTDMGDATGTDFIGFRMIDTALSFIYGKDATSSALQTATAATAQAISAVTLVADTFVDVAFHLRYKASGVYALTIYVNGAAVSHTLVTADVCDNESMTFALVVDDAGGDSNCIVKIDRIEINNYVALQAA